MYSWASAPILLFLFSRLPLSVIHGSTADATVLAQTAPFVLQWLLGIGMLGIMVSALFSLPLMPPRPGARHPLTILGLLLQWTLLPVTLLVFGAIPAVEAQTRLLLGKYLGFYVAEKSR